MNGMSVRFPAPLVPGDLVAVTAPSSGVPDALRPRLDAGIRVLEQRGLRVVVGECMDGSTHVSAPAAERARELTAFLTDPQVRAVVPPWGGETAVDLVELLDWDAIAAAEPTWFVGYSDISTLITPMTLGTAVATLHGANLMDTPYVPPQGLLHWLDVAMAPAGSTLVQTPSGLFRCHGRDDYEIQPEVSEFAFDSEGAWVRLDGGTDEIDVTGRLVGGCIETLANLAGTRFADTSGFAAEHAPEGLIVFVEAAEDDAYDICRNLHGMRLSGFFEHANAVLVGRTNAPGTAHLSQHDAVVDALAHLGVPIIADVDCGHVSPFMPIVNGALGRIRAGADRSSLTQTLA